MVIPCLCLFIALSSLFSELVGAKPLHLLTQTVLLLKHPTGVFVASQTRFCWGVPAPNPAGNEYGKLEVIYAFANIPYLLVVHRPHKLGGHNYR